jgi:biotin carboxylase
LKKLLIAGGGYADIPLIKAGKALGFHVITSGNRSEELGHAHADEYTAADFSDREAVLAIARKHGISAICAACNDFSALSAAYVAQELGLPGHDAVEVSETVHHKDLFRNFSADHGFQVPKAAGFTDIEDAETFVTELGRAALVKPVDLTGGKGISLIKNAEALRDAVGVALTRSKTDRFVVEEFVEGSRHGFSAFLIKGRVVFSFADNEYYYRNPYLVAGAYNPTSVRQESLQDLTGEVERYASLLKLTDGIFHVQFILRDQTPVIIECCRRAPGDLYPELVRHATGVEYAESIVRSAAGLGCGDLVQSQPQACFVRHCAMPAVAGRVRRVRFDTRIEPFVHDQFMWWHPGDEINDVMTHKCGIVFLRFDSSEQMRGFLPQLHDLIRVETEAI